MTIGKNCLGAALLDVIFACGVLAVMAAIAIPGLQASRERDASVLAARYLASRLHALRVEALRRNRTVALRFDPDDLGRVNIYEDGDGDGVLEQDVARGVDPAAGPSVHISRMFENVTFGVPVSVPTPDGSGTLPANSDPVRIGNTNLLSFSALGSGTSGTLYLTGRDGTMVCVRVLGTTGRIRVLRFDRASGAWRPD